MPGKTPRPTDSELEILQVLWANGPSSVRFVYEQISKHRDVGYTTVLKLMQIMAEKGLAGRDTSRRTHIYRARIAEEETQQNLLRRFMDTTFRGSASKLVLQALGNAKTSPEELDEIKALIQRMEDEQE
jgi:BlaI family transcriptional regulator, penicillinase repressor